MELFQLNEPETKVVHFKKEKCDIYVGRPSIWGNPYSHIHDKKTAAQFLVRSREEAINKYREYILNQPELLAKLPELKGKVLGCWCGKCDRWYPGTKMFCHGQVLQELIKTLHL